MTFENHVLQILRVNSFMPFFIGDDYGNIKRLTLTSSDGALKLTGGDDLAGGSKGKQRAIQSMALDTKQQTASILHSHFLVLNQLNL
jgi:hypothetical protein